MAKLKEIVIDARHPAGLARFWAAALTNYSIRLYDDAEIGRLASLGLTPETDPSVLLDGPGPSICFHLRRIPRATTNHMHLDIVGGPRRQRFLRRRPTLRAGLPPPCCTLAYTPSPTSASVARLE